MHVHLELSSAYVPLSSTSNLPTDPAVLRAMYQSTIHAHHHSPVYAEDLDRINERHKEITGRFVPNN
jgi:hypothetical protein